MATKTTDEIFSKSLDKKCLLYSGGMDSYIIYKLEQENLDNLLYIDSKSKYSAIELEYIKKQNLSVPLIVDSTTIDLSRFEMSSAYVPLRNLFFIMTAVVNGFNDIMMGVTSGDRANDKDLTFKKLVESVIDYQLQPAWWHPGSKINVNFKYKDYSKEMLIKEYISKGHDVQDLIDKSFSCYFPENGKECMKCKPDVRKYTFLSQYTDIGDEKRQKLREFYTPEVIAEIENRTGTVHSRGIEDDETLEAIKNDFSPKSKI